MNKYEQLKANEKHEILPCLNLDIMMAVQKAVASGSSRFEIAETLVSHSVVFISAICRHANFTKEETADVMGNVFEKAVQTELKDYGNNEDSFVFKC